MPRARNKDDLMKFAGENYAHEAYVALLRLRK